MYCCDAANSWAICSFRRSTKRVAAIAPPVFAGPTRLLRPGPVGASAGFTDRLARMPTCLVTGGAGFLGSHLCDELLSRGHRVICVDNLETGSPAHIEHNRTDRLVPPDRAHIR